MSNYFNEAGEPLMDGAAMRYEMYLDSTYEPEFDPYDDSGWGEPEECDHGLDCDGTFLGSNDPEATSGDFMCDWCNEIIGRWAMDSEGWPERTD